MRRHFTKKITRFLLVLSLVGLSLPSGAERKYRSEPKFSLHTTITQRIA